MMRLLLLLAIPLAHAVTLTSDVVFDSLDIGTGATLVTDGYEVTVNGSQTGGTIIYGLLDARSGTDEGTTFTQKDSAGMDVGFETSGTGDVLWSPNLGTLVLAGTGTKMPLTVSGSLHNLRIGDGRMKGYWRLDDGSGSFIAQDYTRFNNDGAWKGTGSLETNPQWHISPTHSGSFFNPSDIDLDGTDDYIVVQDVNSLDFRNAMTVSAWVKKPDVTESFAMIVVKTDHNSPNIDRGWSLRFNSTTGETEFMGETPVGDNFRVRSNQSLTNNQWHHVAATYNAGQQDLHMYVDGKDDSDIVFNVGDPIHTHDNELFIGRRNDGFNFNGEIDDVRVYNRALSSSEIVRLAEGDQGTGSGNYVLGRNLTVNGFFRNYTGDFNGTGFTLTVSGGFLNVGNFTGSVVLNGNPQVFSGSMNLNDFTKTNAGSFLIGHESRISASGTLTLQNFSLSSTKTGSQGHLLLDGNGGKQNISDMTSVKDNDASGGRTLNCTINCTDDGNTINWNFAAAIIRFIQPFLILF